jgi:hypothetical protein
MNEISIENQRIINVCGGGKYRLRRIKGTPALF